MSAILATKEAEILVGRANYLQNRLSRAKNYKRTKCAVSTVTMKSLKDTGRCPVTFATEDFSSRQLDISAVSVAILSLVSKVSVWFVFLERFCTTDGH